MKKPALVALLVLLPLSAHAEIFRCEVNGRTTFQDTPCTTGTSSRVNTNNLTVLPTAPPSSRPQTPSRSATPQTQQRSYSSSSSNYQTTTQRRNAEVQARARGVVIPGMSENQAISVLGRPARISSYTFNEALCRRLYWDGSRPFQNGRHTVVICNGEVSSYSGR